MPSQHGEPPLRLITYLVPSVPLGFYELVAGHLEAQLGVQSQLAVDDSRSGPLGGGPLASGEADVAFLCGASVLELTAPGGPGLQVLVAPVPLGERAAGAPRYWSEVVAAPHVPGENLAELAGRSFGFNDSGSLSGVWSVAAELRRLGHDWSFFARIERTGAHVRSLERVARGAVDVAAIDSIVLEQALAADPALSAVRRVTSLGPYPSPPVVARADLDPALAGRVRTALTDPALAGRLRPFGCAGFAAIGVEAYEACRLGLAGGVALGAPPT